MKRIIYIITSFALILLGRVLLKDDLLSFLQWWVTIASIGLIFLPLASVVFTSFHDKGYLFSKTIGIAVTGYIMWVFSSLHLFKFTKSSCFISVFISILINGAVWYWKKKRNSSTAIRKKRQNLLNGDVLDTILGEELLFFGVFLLFTYIRCFKPEAYGTEKFMDYGFMTSMLRSDYMPPQDFWFSGTKLNYYYVGQYLAAFLTRLSGVKVEHGYNLMLMMVGAFAFTLPYSLGYNVFRQMMEDKGHIKKALSQIAGIIAAAAVCTAGNMHYPIFKWFEPLARKFFGMEASKDAYWFPDATRFIGYNPDTTDKTIHEFPAYSFVLGDLHAHVINILFVLTVLGLLFAWLCSRKNKPDQPLPIWKEVIHPNIVIIAFFIGLFHTTNFWDFPIYFVVSGGVILFSNLVVYNFKSKAWLITSLEGIFVILFSEIVSLPFTVNFDQISTNIRLTVAHTPLHQLLILWGLPIVTTIGFLAFIITDFVKMHKEIPQTEIKKQSSQAIQFFMNLNSSDLYIIVLGLCAVGLILIPELIYVEDIYSGDYKRANTMFKLTYQAFILFGVCFGYIFLRLLAYGRNGRQKRYAALGMVLFALTLCYSQNAVNAWYGNIFDRSGYEGLDATAFMKTTMPDDELATNWLNGHVSGTPVVLEAPGDSYTDYQRVSVITGLPTVLGWRTHEWLWKSDTRKLDERADDIETIYTSDEEEVVLQLLVKYDISYIYVGKLEQDKYSMLNHALIKSLGEAVFSNPPTSDKPYETYIIQIK